MEATRYYRQAEATSEFKCYFTFSRPIVFNEEQTERFDEWWGQLVHNYISPRSRAAIEAYVETGRWPKGEKVYRNFGMSGLYEQAEDLRIARDWMLFGTVVICMIIFAALALL